MKIGLTSICLDKQGGISRCVAELAERLVLEHDVRALTGRYTHKIEGLDVEEVNVIWDPISLQVASFAYGNRAPIKKMRDERFDIINSNGAEAINADIVTFHSLQLAAVRQFGMERGLWYKVLKGFEPRNNIVLAIERHNMKNAKKMIAVSEVVKKDIIKNYGVAPERVEVIYNGVNTEMFHPENKTLYRDTIRQKLGIPKEDTVLSFVGWEFKRKGLQYVIEALVGLPSDVSLLVIGGADSDPYKRLATKLGVSDRVYFAGHQSKVEQYLATSDIFVFPTAYEPFGLVITEAMATGIPVVTTATAGAAELITDGVDGCLMESAFSSSEIVEKISYVLDNNLVKKMGEKARITAVRHDWDSLCEKTLKVYEMVSRK